MPSKEERECRKEISHNLREQQRRKVRDSLPAPVSDLKGLFAFLDQQLSGAECDDTLRLTREFIRQSAMNEIRVFLWLEGNGGHCDCEVLNNVEDVIAEAFPGYDQLSGETDSVN